MLSSEHILLESDVRDVPELGAARKVHARLVIQNLLRRRALELTLIDYFYLSVRERRSRSPGLEYVLDLRFADPALRLSRHVPWKWIIATVALATLCGAVGWRVVAAPGPWWQHSWIAVFASLFCAAGVTGIISAWRAHETLVLFSTNGRARLLEFTGGLGTFRVVRRFSQQLAAHLRIAIAARRPAKSEHLRDEMREHFRLKTIGVLAEQDYEAAKRLILAGHPPSTPIRQ
jgi:hypothetical protein